MSNGCRHLMCMYKLFLT